MLHCLFCAKTQAYLNNIFGGDGESRLRDGTTKPNKLMEMASIVDPSGEADDLFASMQEKMIDMVLSDFCSDSYLR